MRFVDGKNVSALSDEDLSNAANLLDKYGIKVSAIGSPIGKCKLSDDFSEHLKLAENVFKIADTLGAKFVRVFSFYAPDGENIADYKAEVFEKMGELLNLAKKYNVTLCHENEAKIYGDVPDRCLELLEYFGGELKCVFDMGNFVLENVKPLEAYDKMKEHIAYFHIKDALFEGAIVPPGKGDANIKEILELHLNSNSANLFVTLEPHLQTFNGLNALVGRSFDNPYKYEDEKTAFSDAVVKFRELI